MPHFPGACAMCAHARQTGVVSALEDIESIKNIFQTEILTAFFRCAMNSIRNAATRAAPMSFRLGVCVSACVAHFQRFDLHLRGIFMACTKFRLHSDDVDDDGDHSVI